MANDFDWWTYSLVGFVVGMFFMTFIMGVVPSSCKSDYHSFTKAMCVEDCKYLEDFEIQCYGDTLHQIHPSGFYVPNTKGLNISNDGEKICKRD
jgi:hypothetical protein